MRVEPLSGASGEEAGVKVTFSRLPVLACSQGHKRFVRPAFPSELLERLSADISVPAGEARGLLFKSYHCGKCGAKLAAPSPALKSFDFQVALDSVEPFSVAVTVPVYACPSCGQEQVRSLAEVTHLASAAIVHAFQAAGIPPGPG